MIVAWLTDDANRLIITIEWNSEISRDNVPHFVRYAYELYSPLYQTDLHTVSQA